VDTTPVITSTSNPLVKEARSLRQRKARAESGLFLVEGIHHVGEAFEAGWDLRSVLYTPELLSSEFGRQLIQRAAGRGQLVRPVSAAVMESLAEKENPQGILAVVRQRNASLEQLTGLQAALALVSPQDPGNVGAILRSIDAAGAGALIQLDGGADPYHPTAVRASMGALFWKPVVQTGFTDFLAWARAAGTRVIGTSARAETDYRSFDPDGPWILLLGSEQKGLAPEQLAACDARISLPMRGRVSSLNLAVAAGILLYQFTSK
jgi:TrmH family RNA methyltransferase